MTDAKRRLRRLLSQVPGLLPLARLVVATIRVCLRYRVTGLASEAGFFALLSLPPLILGLVGGLAYVADAIGEAQVKIVLDSINHYAAQFLTQDVISETLVPTFNDVVSGPRFDLLSLGFLLSLWSGSRALNVFVDTISIMYGQADERGIVHTRVLSFTLYVLALLVGIVTIPLVLLGPSLLGDILPEPWDALIVLYWPLVTLLTVGSLTNLYHVSTPRRSPWLRDVPGAVLTLVIWVLASFFVRGPSPRPWAARRSTARSRRRSCSSSGSTPSRSPCSSAPRSTPPSASCGPPRSTAASAGACGRLAARAPQDRPPAPAWATRSTATARVTPRRPRPLGPARRGPPPPDPGLRHGRPRRVPGGAHGPGHAARTDPSGGRPAGDERVDAER